MAKIGYARVSARGQNDDSQIDLTAYGARRSSPTPPPASTPPAPSSTRPWPTSAGDVFVITGLPRAMRSLKHLLALADELRDRGVGLVVLKQQIDTTTPQGRLIFISSARSISSSAS